MKSAVQAGLFRFLGPFQLDKSKTIDSKSQARI